MQPVDVDAIINELKSRVTARRQSGDYPIGLEEQLEAEFAQIMKAVHRHEGGTGELGSRVLAVETAAAAVSASVETGSRVPGGSTVHATTARLVRRHTNQLSDGVRTLGIEVARALHEVHHLIDVQREGDERQLHEVVNAVLDRLAVLDHVAEAVLDLERRVDALEATASPDA